MKNRTHQYLRAAVLWLAALVLTGCGGATSNTADDSSNTLNVVTKGLVQNVVAGSLVTLDGSVLATTGGAQTYSWTLTSKPVGSSAVLSDPSSPMPTFSADLLGDYVATVEVSNSGYTAGVATATFKVSVGAGNVAPVAEAGVTLYTQTGAPVVWINGTASSDANGDFLNYRWSLISKPAGSRVELQYPTAASPALKADVPGTYVVRLIVNDGKLDSAPDTVSIIATAGTNTIPVANAGPDQTVLDGTPFVTLDGSASTDADGEAVYHSWNLSYKPAGSTATLSDTEVVAPTFTPDRPGIYIARLRVFDMNSESAADTVVITVAGGNVVPVAHAGAAQNVLTGTRVTINGNGSTDANGDMLSYHWNFISVPAGSNAVLATKNLTSRTFVADVPGTYVAKLVVRDGKLNSAPAVVVTATAGTNAIPVANAGAEQNVFTSSMVTLDGLASSDANGDPLTYKWTLIAKPSGSTATLMANTGVATLFTPDLVGAYVVSLQVSDGKVSSAVSTVLINATLYEINIAPVANAGSAQGVFSGGIETVTLNGNASSDANNHSLSYSWTLTSVPAGSGAALLNATSATPNFMPDLAGIYVASLVVNDGALNSSPATVTITATAAANVVWPAGYVAAGGLLWQPNSIGQGASFATAWPTMNYFNYSEAESYCASLSVNGLNGWRLPTLTELYDLNTSGVLLGQTGTFGQAGAWGGYDVWSSQPNNANEHWVSAITATGSGFYADATPLHKTCVRPGPAVLAAAVTYPADFPAGYVRHGGLVWTPDNISGGATLGMSYLFTWPEAAAYCANFSVNGISGWRLPTQPELSALHASLLELYVSGTMNAQGWGLNFTWSSTPYTSASQVDAGYYYFVNLLDGVVNAGAPEWGASVTCVR